MSEKREDLERQINLTFAFLSAESYSRRFLTQSWIRKNVTGYADLSDDAFRKKLQRDLAALHRVGVPIKHFSIDTGPAQGQNGYRLSREDYELPAVDFTAEEAAVLGMAGEMGSTLELGAFARSGWTKLAAGGARRDLSADSPAVSSAGDLRGLSAAILDALLSARQRGRRIAFTYTPDKARPPVRRTMDLWGLVPEGDRIYLVGFDPDRGAVRCFRITRVSGVDILGAAVHQPPAGTNLQEVVREQLRGYHVLTDATIRVEPGRAVPLTEVAEALGDNRWRLHDVDRRWLVRTAAAHAPAAVVEEPAEVIEEVVDLLQQSLREVD